MYADYADNQPSRPENAAVCMWQGSRHPGESNLLQDLVQVDLVGLDVLHDPKNSDGKGESRKCRE